MKALVPAGRPDALVALADTGLPEPQPGEALVKVEAFSVNRGEIFQLEHPRPGTRPGKDIAGLVVQAAADGTGPAAGSGWSGIPKQAGGPNTPRCLPRHWLRCRTACLPSRRPRCRWRG